jgi:uncharacterized protein YdeI (YjbR/CyaY-like superfamily)
MPAQEKIDTITPKTRKLWRKWLEKNHDRKDSVWLIYHKKNSKTPSMSWSDAVEEALCFGWIDSKRQAIDETTFRQFFGKRKPKSLWSGINKDKVKRLIDDGLMTSAGLAAIEVAKKNGYWTLLDDVEKRIVPPDLERALKKTRGARKFFDSLSSSDRRILLQWVVLAKQDETRKKRINEIVAAASKGVKPKQLG